MSLLHAATTGSLSSVGIPPNIASRISDFLTEHALDFFVLFTIGVELSLRGTITHKRPASGSGRTTGRAALGIEGSVGVGVGARLGDEASFHIEARGSVNTGLEAEGGVEVRSEGLFLVCEVTWPGATLNMAVCLRHGEDWDIYEREFSWPLAGEVTLYEGEKRIGAG